MPRKLREYESGCHCGGNVYVELFYLGKPVALVCRKHYAEVRNMMALRICQDAIDAVPPETWEVLRPAVKGIADAAIRVRLFYKKGFEP